MFMEHSFQSPETYTVYIHTVYQQNAVTYGPKFCCYVKNRHVFNEDDLCSNFSKFS